MAGTNEPTIALVAADVGGTFTDVIVRWDDGGESTAKVPSTAPNYDEAIAAAVQDLAIRRGAARDVEVHQVVHGSTVATNTLLESKGARTALVTTTGFRDVLELGRLRRPSLFDLRYIKPEPLVPRMLRREIPERTAASGDVLVAADRSDIAALVADFIAADVDAVAVCLLNSYANPDNELKVAGWISEEFGAAGRPVPVTASSQIQREIREFERTSTTVINAYVGPAVSRYLDRLTRYFADRHRTGRLQIMQSNGSLISDVLATRFPCRLIESGPAAGVLAAAHFVADLNGGDAIAFDMGGTTAKAALIEGGVPMEALQLEVGGQMNQNGAAVAGSGYVIRLPSLDISEVGAGGGSIVWIDGTGAPRVGPESAGADPGPACYGTGGDRPTVTDANVLLGYLDVDGIAGGTMPLQPDLARQAMQRGVATPLGIDVVDAAWGVHQLANAGMELALRSVSVERGRVPRSFMLVAYGGAGPMHAATLASSFGVDRVMIPPRPGLLCAHGLALAPVRHDVVVAYPPAERLESTRLGTIVTGMQSDIAEVASEEGVDLDDVEMAWHLAVRYAGQNSELLVRLEPDVDLATGAAGTLFDVILHRFTVVHEKTYGYADAHAPMEVVSVRASAEFETGALAGSPGGQPVTPVSPDDTRNPAPRVRPAYFGSEHGWCETPVLGVRTEARSRCGPLIIVESDSTVVVPPGWLVDCDDAGRLLLTKEDL